MAAFGDEGNGSPDEQYEKQASFYFEVHFSVLVLVLPGCAL